MFEGFIRNGYSGELALDDIRLGTDIPLENCMGTFHIQPWGPGVAGGAAEPSRAGSMGHLSPACGTGSFWISAGISLAHEGNQGDSVSAGWGLLVQEAGSTCLCHAKLEEQLRVTEDYSA